MTTISNDPKVYPLVGFSTSLGRFGVIRALGGKLTISPEALSISGLGENWSISKNLATNIARSGFVLHIASSEQSFSIITSKVSSIIDNLESAGYKVNREGNKLTQFVFLFIVLAILIFVSQLINFISFFFS